MDEELMTIKNKKELDVEEEFESPQSIESPRQIISEAGVLVESFEGEVLGDVESAEKEASEKGLMFDRQDKESLLGLNEEAEAAKEKLIDEITPPPLPEEDEAWTPDSDFPPPLSDEQKVPGQNSRNESAMKDRVIQTPELLSEKEASKRLLAEERKKLAEELFDQRKINRENIINLKGKVATLNKELENTYVDWEEKNKEFESLNGQRAQEANSFAGRLRNLISRVSGYEFEKDKSLVQTLQEKQDELEILKKNEETFKEELGNLNNLIESDTSRQTIKEKIEEHYSKADSASKEHFEMMKKSVEQTTIRNKAFIVHTFLSDDKLRHNDNSNILNRATFEDDVDILLSLEPSISTSSVVPGSKQGLWGNGYGVVIGGGDIYSARGTDDATVSKGIKKRLGGEVVNSEKLDELVSNKEDRGYNELVVDNPKVFGFFQNVEVDESGKMVGFKKGKNDTGRKIKEHKDNFMVHMNFAAEKGMPLLVMTPDRRIYEFGSVDDDGIVSVGEEITPEQVASNKAGLENSTRKEIGDKIISKNLFRNIETQKEAKKIIAELSGQKNSEIELSKEEYMAYVKDNQGRYQELPKYLLRDGEFMKEAARFDPVSAYRYAAENLQRDINFIKHIYSLERKGTTSSIYSLIPEDLKKEEAIALLALENEGVENLNLDIEFKDSPLIWEKIIDKKVENFNPDKYFSKGEGDKRVIDTYLIMMDGRQSVTMKERLVSDGSLVKKLSEKYLNYKFEIESNNDILVTRLVN
jgi:hypothetical protein